MRAILPDRAPTDPDRAPTAPRTADPSVTKLGGGANGRGLLLVEFIVTSGRTPAAPAGEFAISYGGPGEFSCIVRVEAVMNERHRE